MKPQARKPVGTKDVIEKWKASFHRSFSDVHILVHVVEQFPLFGLFRAFCAHREQRKASPVCLSKPLWEASFVTVLMVKSWLFHWVKTLFTKLLLQLRVIPSLISPFRPNTFQFWAVKWMYDDWCVCDLHSWIKMLFSWPWRDHQEHTLKLSLCADTRNKRNSEIWLLFCRQRADFPIGNNSNSNGHLCNAALISETCNKLQFQWLL